MNESLGAGIAVFQGLSNVALNCEPEQTEQTITYYKACGIVLFMIFFPPFFIFFIEQALSSALFSLAGL